MNTPEIQRDLLGSGKGMLFRATRFALLSVFYLLIATNVYAAQSDLIVVGSLSVSPNPITAGNTLTVGISIKNQGAGTAPATSTHLQIKNTALTATVADQNYSTPAISAGQTISQNYSISIPAGTTAGNYNAYVMLDRYNVGNQSNGSNDEGSSNVFSIIPPTTTPTLSFTATPGSITSGQSSTLSWSSANATSCTASGGWTGAKSVSGSQVVSPSTTTTYTLSCSGTGGSVTQSATVTVTQSTGLLTVTVQRSDMNAVLSGATVSLNGGPSSPPSQPTGSDGTTTFSDLTVGNYTVTASLAEYQTNYAPATVVANTTTQVPLLLTPIPQQAKKRVVILVHGVNADSGSFGLMRNFLESTGQFRVYYFNYSSLGTGADTPIALIGSYFKHKCIDNIKKGKVCASSGEDPDQARPIEDIETIDTSSVDIVAHSMGGLVALSYVSGMATNKYEHDVGRFVTLATPFFGSRFANFFQGSYEGREMARASGFLWHLQQWWTHDGSFSDFAKTKKADILNVVGTMGSDAIPDSDTIVPVVSAVLPDLDIRSRYVRKCHANLSWLNCNGSDAIAYVLNESHPSYKLVESFLRNGSDPDNCPEPECSPTPPTTTGDLFVRFVEKLSPTIPISVSTAAKVLAFDPNPNDLGWASNGSAGTLLVTHLPAGPYRTTVHGSEINLVNFYQDEVLPITSIHAGRTTVLPQLGLQKKIDSYTVTLATPKDGFVAGKDVFPLDVQLCCTIPAAQLNSYPNLALDALSQSTLIDGYTWTEIPGGGRFFLMPDFTNFTDQRTPVVSSFPIENFAGTVLSMFIPSDLPTGTYTFFAVGVVPGSDPFNSANWVTNRAELSVTLTQ